VKAWLAAAGRWLGLTAALPMPLTGTAPGAGAFSSGEAEILRQKGLTSIDDVWRTIGTDFDSGINALAEKTTIPKSRLVEALTIAAVREAEAGPPPLHRQHRLQGVLLLMLPFAALGVLLVRAFVLPATNAVTPIVYQVVAKPSGGLPALHLIEAGDLERRLTPFQAGALTATDQAVGRQTQRAIASGAPVRESHLSAAGEPARQLVSVPVLRGRLSPDLKAGGRATLLFYPRGRAQSPTQPTSIADIPVTAIDRSSSPLTLVVAMTPEQLAAATPLLATSEVVVVQPKP
jgi:hypothetical protein